MQRDATGRCRFCGLLYYLEKIPAHERQCKARPVRQVGLGRPLTPKEAKLVALLETGSARFADLLRAGVYGSKGLSRALTGLLAVGLAERNEQRRYLLTEEGKKQALRRKVVEALDGYLESATYDEFAKEADFLLLVMPRPSAL